MNDTLSPTPTFSLPNPPEPGAPAGRPGDQGLRSSQGIRWLLLAGALVCGVSVYRLVQAQWSFLPPPLQFLILVSGALSIFGLGSLTRRRLHLPYAGSALLSLFAGLVPVLAWGAAYLNLLSTPSGWLAFGAGLAVLLGAARQVLAAELKYRGLLYPAILGILLTAQAVLPWLAGRFPAATSGLYVAAALLLGTLLYAGTLHINRFFFHRDRCDGVERPVRFIPFLMLGLLYAGALTLLDRGSHFMALPLAVLGMVLASTGEEYYRALTESLGAAPERWPRRSLALIAVGLCLLAGAVPLALLDGTGVCLALVTLGAAFFLLRWSLRYKTAGLYAVGLLAALGAYTASPALFRPVARMLLHAVTAATGVASDAALLALGQLGFFALLVAGAAWLRRIDVPERLRQVHAVAAALHLAAVTLLALQEVDGFLVLPAALVLAVLGAALSRRAELAAGCALPSLALVASLWALDAPRFQVALLTQAFFVLAWLLGRRSETFFAWGGKAAAFCHALLGLGGLGLAVLAGGVGIEPLILLLLGLAFLDEGLRHRRRDLTGQGLGLLAAFAGVQAGVLAGWDSPGSWLVGFTASAVVLAAFIRIARHGLGDRMARRLSLGEEEWKTLILTPLAGLVHLWGMGAVLLCLIFSGPEALVLSAALVGLVFLARLDLAGRAPRAAFPLRPSLLLLVQLVALAGAPAEGFLPAALLTQGFDLLPLAAGLVLVWRFLGEALGRRWAVEPWSTVTEGLVAIGYLAALFWTVVLTLPLPFSAGQSLFLMGVAALWSLLSGAAAWRGRREADVWAMQAWVGLIFVQALTAGWLVLGNAPTPYLLLGAGAGLYALAQLLGRTELRTAFFAPCRTTGLALPLAAGLLALHRTWNAHGDGVWFPAFAVFLVSLFYLIVASREERRVFPSLASAVFLGLPFIAVIDQTHLGLEFYSLAPGLALLTLAWLLRAELGERWSRHVVAAGASCLYATPIVALSDQISWGWLAALLVLAIAFGTASLSLRSRSLLTVSTAALLTDLGFFIFRIGTTAPTLLWVLGALFGLAVMGAAAYLEYQREGVLQQIRVFGRELQAWS